MEVYLNMYVGPEMYKKEKTDDSQHWQSSEEKGEQCRKVKNYKIKEAKKNAV